MSRIIHFLILLVFFQYSCTLDEEQPSKDTPLLVVLQDSTATSPVSWPQVAALDKPDFDQQLSYGDHPLQFGELRLPEGQGPFPLAVFIHGGCWLSAFNLDHVAPVCEDLTRYGIAVWTPEYRRIGDEGGGYPNTFLDAVAAVNYVNEIAKQFPVDPHRVLVMGHSAGGHLALWLAGQHQLPANHELQMSLNISLRGVIALAGITDLAAYQQVNNSCSRSVTQLTDDQEERLRYGSPSNLLPANIPLCLVHGEVDNIVPLSQSEEFLKKADQMGDNIQLSIIKNAGHFDLVYPNSFAWQRVREEALELLK